MLAALPKQPFIASQVQIVNKILPLAELPKEKMIAPTVRYLAPKGPSVFALSKPTVFTSGTPMVVSQLTGPVQFRLAHTDVKFPDYSAVRAKKFDPTEHHKDITTQENNPVDPQYTVLYGGVVMGACGLVAAKVIAQGMANYWMPTSDIRAMATVEVDLNKIPEGKTMTFKWRGKPIFIRHRTTEQIETEAKVDIADLRDKEHDSERTTDPKFLIVIGICTHLGCVPISNKGNYGGFFCPCHGSHYDGSGRIRKGPAPLNLEVPKHVITGNLVTIG